MIPFIKSLPRATFLATLFMLGFLWESPPATAGPAKYDPKTRSFNLTYTYAFLPSFGMSSDQIESLGQLQEATKAQDAKIRAYHKTVSNIIEDVTNQRAKIGSFDYVESIKKADIIISLTGNFQRAGWAVQGAIEGRPGQVGLYYQYLDEQSQQNVAFSMAHEICHYLFGLPDEYDLTGGEAVCPQQNPDSPGCLMDNYFNRHGYRKMCGDSDHNADGPRFNPMTIVAGTRAEDSCQLRIENFFKDHPPGPAVDNSDGGDAEDVFSTPPSTVTPSDPFTGRFRQLVNSAAMAVRDRFKSDNADLIKKKQKPKLPDASKAKTFAQDFFKKQLDELAGDKDFQAPTKDQVAKAVDMVVQQVLGDKLKPPKKFNNDLIAQLRAKARELAGSTPRPEGDFLKRLFSDQSTSLKELKPVIDKVAKGLLEFLAGPVPKALLGLAPTESTSKVLDPETKQFIDQIAREAVMGPGGTSEFANFLEAAKLHIRLSLNATQTLNSLASDLDLPGPELRRNALRDLETRLGRFSLPGKPFTGFGFRRTYLVAPHPLDPNLDRIRIDAGDNLQYHDIRNLIATHFMRLIQRERTELVNDPIKEGKIQFMRLDEVASEGPLTEMPKELDQNQRFAKQVSLISQLVEQVRRDRVENIIFLVPPGGLSQELGEVLEEFRIRVLNDADVRVDVVLSESGTIPGRLRDTVAQTGGSVQTAIDLDEVGAVAQRLKNEVASGSWVSTPQKGYIDFSDNAMRGVAPSLRARQAREPIPFKKLLSRYGKPDDNEKSKRSYTRTPLGDAENRYYLVYPPLPKASDFVLGATINDLEAVIKKLQYLITHEVREEQFRPDSFPSVLSALSGLFKLKTEVGEMQEMLQRIEVAAPNATTHRRIHDLIEKIYQNKRNLRSLFGSKSLFRAPLTSTDDYFDWGLRKLLAQKCGNFAQDLKDKRDLVFGSDPPSRSFKPDIYKQFRYVNSLSTLSSNWQRASMKNQELADATSLHTESESILNNNDTNLYNFAQGMLSPGGDERYRIWNEHQAENVTRMDEHRDQLREEWELVDHLQQREALTNPDASFLLLNSAESLTEILELIKVKAKERPYFTDYYRINTILTAARLLERASQQTIDPIRLGKQVTRLRTFLEDLRRRTGREYVEKTINQLREEQALAIFLSIYPHFPPLWYPRRTCPGVSAPQLSSTASQLSSLPLING
jgi:hypothetical protein